MNLDKLCVDRISVLNSDNYPLIVIKDSKIDEYLKKFFLKKRKINVVMGKIFSQLGYTKEDIIYLKNISCYDRNNVMFEYCVNLVNDSSRRIVLDFDEFIYKYNMSIEDRENIVNINCNMYSYRDIRLKVNRIEKKLDNDKRYVREYNYNTIKYMICIGDIEISISLYKSIYVDEYQVLDDYDSMLILDKEKEIEEYLSNVDLPVSIDKLFKDIVILIGEVNLYKEVIFKIAKKNEESKEIVTDKIMLVNGECIEFIVTRGNKRVTLLGDLEWKYDYSDELYRITSSGNGVGVTYSVSAKSEVDLKECVVWSDLEYDLVREEIDNTKKLVRRLFKEDRQ